MEEAKLTAKEIFDEIAALRKHLTEDDPASLRHLTNALAMLGGGEDEERDGSGNEPYAAQVEQVCDMFRARELNLLKMLELYERMYNNLQIG